MKYLIPIVAVTALLLVVSQRLTTSEISAIIAPHHDLVADYREQMFADIAKKQDIDRFILITPDHYKIEEGDILVGTENYTTRFGGVSVAPELVDLALDNGAKVAGPTIESEHGIKTILPDLARHFPDSTFLPVAIKHEIDQDKLDAFVDAMSDGCADCVLIGSIDLSHYQPYAISELHDRVTMRAIRTLDEDLAVTKSETGPPHVVRSFIRWGERRGTTQFTEHFKTNSTTVSGDLFEEGTTHVGGWYDKGDVVDEAPSVTFTYAGDVMFDRGVETTIERLGGEALLSRLGDRVLWGTDIVMANLEGPLTARDPLPMGANNAPRFSFMPSAVTQLDFLHIDALNIKNNHRLDAGQAGVEDTKRILEANEIDTADEPIVREGNDLAVVTFGVDVVDRETLSAEDFAPYLDDEKYRIVVYAHWGPEGELEQSTTQERLAREWVDAGADLVVGTGPHVVQGAEVYKNRPIVYSLGNFIFDMQESVETSQGLVVAGEFTGAGVELTVSLIDGTELRPFLGRAQAYDNRIVEKLSGLSAYLTHAEGGVIFTINR